MGKVEVRKSKGSNQGCLYVLAALGVIFLMFICVIGVVAVALVANIAEEQEVFQESFNEPLEDTERATLDLEIKAGELRVGALNDSQDLLDASISYTGELEFSVQGETNKQMRLHQTSGDSGLLGALNILNIADDEELLWRVDLNPDVLFELEVDGGVGLVDLSLGDFSLAGLTIDVGVGEVNVTLPLPDESYLVEIDGGIGDVEIILPEDAAVRVEAQIGIGEISVPASLNRLDDDSSPVGVDGVWKTNDFGEADQSITIIFDGGIGKLTIR